MIKTRDQKAYRDGEVIGRDSDGCLILWNGGTGAPYNCGETLEEFDAHNLTPEELARLD